jgi:hypothetical protein
MQNPKKLNPKETDIKSKRKKEKKVLQASSIATRFV